MKVRIYKPSRHTMQSGFARTKSWIIEQEQETRRFPEALMGWTAAGDTSSQVRLKFPTQEQAVAYAQEKGWEYAVDIDHGRIVRPRNYVDNFRYIPPKTNVTE